MSVVLPERQGRQGQDRRKFAVDFPFTKAITKQGDLQLKGYASTWVEDRDGEVVAPDAFDLSLPLYLQKNPILLWQHNFDWPLGQVQAADIDEYGLAVEAFVRKPETGEADWKLSAYHDIKAGIVKTFSIGGWMTKELRGGMPVISEVELWEISVVSVPANPDSIFQAATKAIQGTPNRAVLHPKATEQMAQILGLEPVSDPELARMDDAARKGRYDSLAQLYRSAGHVPPEWDEWRQVAKSVLAHDAGDRATVIAQARATTAVIKKVHGLVLDTKRGRMISKANETKLRDAKALLDEVLGQLEKAEERDDADAEEPHAYQGDGGACTVCGQRDDAPIHDVERSMAAAGQRLAAHVQRHRYKGKQAEGEVWDPEQGFQDILQDINQQLNPSGDPYAVEATWWAYDLQMNADGAGGRVLVRNWADDADGYVATFVMGEDGDPVLAGRDTWVEVEQVYVAAD